jgi:hypothetical protein
MLNPELLERLEKQRKHRTVRVYGKLKTTPEKPLPLTENAIVTIQEGENILIIQSNDTLVRI